MRGHGNHGRLPLVNIPVGGPFDCIGMDFVELDVSQDGNRYALVLQDFFDQMARSVCSLKQESRDRGQMPFGCSVETWSAEQNHS